MRTHLGSAEATALDPDGDGALTGTDDPYAPYWPGDDEVPEPARSSHS